ncbi:MAG: HD-GYP domain-containing protein [Candidatus Omnitrophota bacterium]
MKNPNKIDYKKELESASKTMIMIHDPKLLIKLMVRTIVSKVQIKHAGMILYEPKKDSYVLDISRGEAGFKVPSGFARFDKNNPIIKLFTKHEYKSLTVNRNAIISDDLNKLIWQESVLNGANGNGATELLHKVAGQMQMYNAIACVPAYYQNHLLAILLLGEKKDGSKFEQDELDFFAALASDAAMAIRNAQLFSDLKKEADRNRQLFIQTTIVLGSTIEAKDKYTRGHTGRVTNYSIQIARHMTEAGVAAFSSKFLEDLYIAGILHDIGKIGIPESILNKEGTLTPEEYEVMKQHPVRGAEILQPLSELKGCIEGVKYHHERYDGTGYPSGLKGDEIPIVAAIIAVADTFDAMTTDRPYRKGLTRDEAIKEIERNIGKQFHPKPAQALIALLEEGKI